MRAQVQMKKFPEFITTDADRVAEVPDPSMAGFVFEGEEDVQIVFWQCENGGESAEHVHDFWECLTLFRYRRYP